MHRLSELTHGHLSCLVNPQFILENESAGSISHFSSYGPAINLSFKPDISAPGSLIVRRQSGLAPVFCLPLHRGNCTKGSVLRLEHAHQFWSTCWHCQARQCHSSMMSSKLQADACHHWQRLCRAHAACIQGAACHSGSAHGLTAASRLAQCSTWPLALGGYYQDQGTSMAAGSLAGTAALVLQAKPGPAPWQLDASVTGAGNGSLTTCQLHICIRSARRASVTGCLARVSLGKSRLPTTGLYVESQSVACGCFMSL